MEKNIIQDWKLERYLLGELPAQEFEDIRILESARDGVRERLEALRAENAAILRRYPPEAVGRKIENASAIDRNGVPKWRAVVNRYKPQSVKTTGVPKWVIPAAVCAIALLIIPIRLAQVDTGAAQYQNGAFEDRAKGTGTAQSIEVWRKNGAEAERLPPDAVARSGDVIQLRYIVPEPCYGALISVDGRGVTTVHLSGESGKATPLTPGRPVALSNSYQLDDAPLFETFYLVTAKDNFDIESVKQSLLDRNNKQYLHKDQFITIFTLRK
jgi:hypothetical protein